MARLPRLSVPKYGIPLGAIGFIVCAALYRFLIPFWDLQNPRLENRFDAYADYFVGGLNSVLPFHLASMILLAVLVIVVVYTLNHFFPKCGLYTLLLPGLLIVIGMVVVRVMQAEPLGPGQESKPVWPVLLALAGLLYLWWLAILLLDLVLVWHGYTQNSLAMDRLRAMAGWTDMSKPRRNKRTRPAAPHAPAAPTQMSA